MRDDHSDDEADGDGAGDDDAATGTGATDGFVIVQRYPSGRTITPGEIRLAVSLARSDGSLLTDGPEVLEGVMRNEQGLRIDTIAATRRGTGLDVPYWSITTTIPKVGLYDIVFDGATGDPVPFFVYDPAEVTLPYPGTALPPFDTPTLDDAAKQKFLRERGLFLADGKFDLFEAIVEPNLTYELARPAAPDGAPPFIRPSRALPRGTPYR